MPSDCWTRDTAHSVLDDWQYQAEHRQAFSPSTSFLDSTSLFSPCEPSDAAIFWDSITSNASPTIADCNSSVTSVEAADIFGLPLCPDIDIEQRDSLAPSKVAAITSDCNSNLPSVSPTTVITDHTIHSNTAVDGPFFTLSSGSMPCHTNASVVSDAHFRDPFLFPDESIFSDGESVYQSDLCNRSHNISKPSELAGDACSVTQLDFHPACFRSMGPVVSKPQPRNEQLVPERAYLTPPPTPSLPPVAVEPREQRFLALPASPRAGGSLSSSSLPGLPLPRLSQNTVSPVRHESPSAFEPCPVLPHTGRKSSFNTESSSDPSTLARKHRAKPYDRSKGPKTSFSYDADGKSQQSGRKKRKRSLGFTPRDNNDCLLCPCCAYVQKKLSKRNLEMTDYLRHVALHKRDDSRPDLGVWCKGVLLSEAHKWDVPSSSEPRLWLGKMRIGGCFHSFSRKDSLLRHLRGGSCVGAALGALDEPEL
ncbi:hypothetical protein FISHEDRAFT_77522 [Fistulina hepatica ATCC 64428]|uniref:Uncharacterized protein n=1 Tax=Fistulina hepatica ATCC 64428 TaxID=1128425 RepID=A0A0D7A0L4_9AGAR|nr:hypothetical protein FISHEDRAFT_77522 [Fistulina hepatica ATCC 64428]